VSVGRICRVRSVLRVDVVLFEDGTGAASGQVRPVTAAVRGAGWVRFDRKTFCRLTPSRKPRRRGVPAGDDEPQGEAMDQDNMTLSRVRLAPV
jgi:hypothetical protein